MKKRRFWSILLSLVIALQLCLLPAAAAEVMEAEGTSETGTEQGTDGSGEQEIPLIPKDISAWVDRAATLTIGDKTYTESEVAASGISVEAGTDFSYRLDWALGKGEDQRKLVAGDHFTVTVLAAPGMYLGNSNTVTNDLYHTPKDGGERTLVGAYTLTVQKPNTAEAKLELTVVFNEAAAKFDVETVEGFVGGSGVFKKDAAGSYEGDIILGDATGSFVVTKPGPTPPDPTDPPTDPGEGDQDVGTGWRPTNPPKFEGDGEDYIFGKGHHSYSKENDMDPRIQWRLVYLEQLQALQRAYLDAKENGRDVEEVFQHFSSAENIIIEDTLDENQVFRVGNFEDYLKSRYQNGAPFYFELPIMVPGTGTFLNIGPYDVGADGNYDGAGDMINFMSGNYFTRVDAKDISEFKDNSKPMTWAIVKNTDGTETLVINLGKLGAVETTEGLFLMNPSENVDSKWENWKNKLDTLLTEKIKECEIAGSPLWLMDQRVAALKAALGEIEKDSDVQKYFDEYDVWRGSFDSYQTAIANPPDYTALKAELDAAWSTKEVYGNFLKSAANLMNDQQTYLAKWNSTDETYKTGWETAKANYENTKAFYQDCGGRIFGFVMKYSTKITNPLAGTYSNSAKLSTVEKTANDKIEATFNFSGGVTGSYLPGTVVVEKVNSVTGTSLAGAVFQVYQNKDDPNTLLGFVSKTDASGTTIYVYDQSQSATEAVTNLSVNENGKLLLYKLPRGTYYVKEIAAPYGYYLAQGLLEVTSDIDAVTTFQFKNEQMLGSVTLTKTDKDTSQRLPGVQFALHVRGENGAYRRYDDKTYTTDANGRITITNLPVGEYWLEETGPLASYEPNTSQGYFKITAEQLNVLDLAVTNVKRPEPPVTGSVTMTKVDEDTEQPLPDVQFALHVKGEDGAYHRYDEKTYSTDVNGEITITGLPVGEYWLEELEPPASYELDKFQGYFTITADHPDVLDLVVTNVKTPEPTVVGSVTLTKVDHQTGKVLQDAKFKLYSKDEGDKWVPYGDGTLYVTGADGKITIEELPAGAYWFQEVEEPDGYQKNEIGWFFSITKEETEIEVRAANVKLPEIDPPIKPEEPDPDPKPDPDPDPDPDPEPDPEPDRPDPPRPDPNPDPKPDPAPETPEPGPETPEVPDTPETPEIPETPETPEPPEEPETPETAEPPKRVPQPGDPDYVELDENGVPIGSMEGENPTDPEYALNDPNAPTGAMEGEKLPQTGWSQTALAAAAIGGAALLAAGLILRTRRLRRR